MDVMDLLAQAKPASLEPRPDPARRASDLAAAIAAPRDGQEDPRPGTAPPRRVTPRRATPRRVTRRRVTPRRVAVGAGIAVLAGAAAAAVALATTGVPAAPARSGQLAVPSPAALRKAVLTAFEGVSGDIFYSHVVLTTPQGSAVISEWSYPAVPQKGQVYRDREYYVPDRGPHKSDVEQIFRQDVNPKGPHGTYRISTRNVVAIDVEYGNHTWSRTNQGAVTITSNGPSVFQQEFAHGTIGSIVKTEFDGRPAYKVTIDDKAQGTVTTDWLDAQTYRPLRTVSKSGRSGFTTESAYLPPTAANLAKLNVTIPAGFKRTRGVELPKG